MIINSRQQPAFTSNNSALSSKITKKAEKYLDKAYRSNMCFYNSGGYIYRERPPYSSIGIGVMKGVRMIGQLLKKLHL